MDALDNVLKLLGIGSTVTTIYLLVRKAPFENKALAGSAKKVAAEAEALELTNDDKKRQQLAEMDASIGKMRVLVGEQAQQYDQQQEQLKLLIRDKNAQAEKIVQLERAVTEAKDDTASYKSKWEATQTGLDECRASCQQQAAAIRILRAVLTRHNLLTEELELEIERTLTPLPDATVEQATVMVKTAVALAAPSLSTPDEPVSGDHTD